jgi:hypothetical protein
VRIRIAAGEHWDDLVRWTLAQGYPGLENLILIPGSVGAALEMPPTPTSGRLAPTQLLTARTMSRATSPDFTNMQKDDCAVYFQVSIRGRTKVASPRTPIDNSCSGPLQAPKKHAIRRLMFVARVSAPWRAGALPLARFGLPRRNTQHRRR